MQDMISQINTVATTENVMMQDFDTELSLNQNQLGCNLKNTSAYDFKIESKARIEEQPPNFTQHEVAVPFGCSEEQIEQALFKFLVDLISPKPMQHIRKLFFVPVGLPGMGKSTLAKYIKISTEKHLNKQAVTSQKTSDSQILDVDEKTKKLSEYGLTEGMLQSLPEVNFQKISYDKILGDNTAEYGEQHPEVPFHEIIDIIRAKADQDYLDQIARHCISEPQSNVNGQSEMSSEKFSENVHSNYGYENIQGVTNLPKTIIYLDRNNTPDVWADIKQTVLENSYVGQGQLPDFRTVVLLPKQENFDQSLYNKQNPICPHLVFECCKRIFNRKEHGCLSGANKPKAVEVVLKFAKLHDGYDFHNEKQVRSYFDDVLVLDFMKYSSRPQPLLDETLQGLIGAYNATPENFGVPSDEIIQNVINLVDRQMEIDFANDKLHKKTTEDTKAGQYLNVQDKQQLLDDRASENHRSHGSTKKWSPYLENKFKQISPGANITPLATKLCFNASGQHVDHSGFAQFKDIPSDNVAKIVLGPAASKPVLLNNQISIHHSSTTCDSSNKSSDATSSSAADCELVNNVKVLDHRAEFFEGDLSVEISVSFDNGAVNELLKLNVIQVIAHHHFQDLEQFSV